jgi:hypothetical protein
MVAAWSFKIMILNRGNTVVYQYKMNEEIKGENISIKAVDALFLSQNDFLTYFNIEDNVFELYDTPEGKIICICLEVTNLSNENIEWDNVMSWTYCGFETRTWASTNMSYVEQKMNVFQTDSLYSGQTQAIWYATLVSPVCFKTRTWNELKVEDFDYVLCLTPEKVRIRME